MIDDVTGGRDEPKRPGASRRRGLGKGLGAILPSAGLAGEDRSRSDQLTGLPTRSLLDERFEEAMARCREDGASLAVLVVALDGFGEVNEVYGHRVGDDLLHEAAARLSGPRRKSDAVARFAGDEFAVVCPYVASPHMAGRMAQRILDDLSRPLSVDGVEHHLTASIGVVVTTPAARTAPTDRSVGASIPTHGDLPSASAGASVAAPSLETLLGHASLAMRHAKEAGGASWKLFEPTMREHVVVRSQSRQDLRAAMEEGGLVLDYEPIVDVETGMAIGESARLGWRQPSPDADQPQALLDLADEAGIAAPIGRWVLDQALADLSARLADSSLPEHFRTWVKVAPSLMADPAFVGTVDELTAKHGVAASRLGLDIREPSPAAVASTGATLSALTERDVVVTLDDFGAGPSNLALLQRLPITGLKLAPELVAALGDPAGGDPTGGDPTADDPAGRDGAALVGALIELARALDFSVVAQGVETEAQLVLLRALGCEYAQGPLFGRDVPIESAPDTSLDAPDEREVAPAPTDTAPDAPTVTASGGGVAPAPPAESLWAAGTMTAVPTPGASTAAP